jgi:hypothetical protein
MPFTQLRPVGHERSAARQRPSPLRLLKDTRCWDCRMREPPTATANTAPQSCHHNLDFAPSSSISNSIRAITALTCKVNRFSVLAELDQQTYRSKRTFDLARSPTEESRGRAKSREKNNKLKDAKQRQEKNRVKVRASAEDLCRDMSTLFAEGEETEPTSPGPSNSSKKVPQGDFTFSANARHEWVPQFQPRPRKTQAVAQAPIQPPDQDKISLPPPLERCLEEARAPPPDMSNWKRTESRFFPKTARLATPETAGRHPANTAARKQLSIVVPNPAQKAATTAAYRALANVRTASSPSTRIPSAHNSRPSSPSPLAQTLTPNSPGTPTAGSPLMSSPTAPLPITPSLAASPAWTISPTISTLPSLASSPSIISNGPSWSQTPSPTPPHHKWISIARPHVSSPTSPFSIDTLPGSQAIIPPVSLQATVKRGPTFSKPIIPAVPTLKHLTQPKIKPVKAASSSRVLKQSLVRSKELGKISEELAEFLDLGHANPCWCNAHKNGPPTPPIPIKAQPASSSDHMVSTPGDCPTSQYAASMEDAFSDSDLSSVLFTPSPLDSEFEDIGRSVGSDAEYDDDWTLLSPGLNNEQYTIPSSPTNGLTLSSALRVRRKRISSSFRDTELAIVTPMDATSPPEHQDLERPSGSLRAPPPTPRTVRNSEEAAQHAHQPDSLGLLYSEAAYRAHTQTSSSEAPTPTTTTITHCSPAPLSYVPGTAAAFVNADSAEWPRLQAANPFSTQTRRKKSGGSSGDEYRGCVWDGVMDWF